MNGTAIAVMPKTLRHGKSTASKSGLGFYNRPNNH